MNRVIAILLCLCGAVVCAFLAYVGYQQDLNDKKVAVELPKYSCSELLEAIPNDLSRFTFEEFKPGKHFVSYDDDKNGEWEQVWVPMFPVTTKRLNKNYRAVLVNFVDAPNKEALFEKLDSGSIEADYWFTSQELDARSYSRLAEDYKSLDFKRSVLVYSGYPSSKVSFGSYLFWGASGGAMLSMLVFGWQSFSLVIAGIRSESRDDDDDEEITNRAGLPTKESPGEYDL